MESINKLSSIRKASNADQDHKDKEDEKVIPMTSSYEAMDVNKVKESDVKTDKADKIDKIEKAEKTDKTEKIEKTEKTEKTEKIEKKKMKASSKEKNKDKVSTTGNTLQIGRAHV